MLCRSKCKHQTQHVSAICFVHMRSMMCGSKRALRYIIRGATRKSQSRPRRMPKRWWSCSMLISNLASGDGVSGLWHKTHTGKRSRRNSPRPTRLLLSRNTWMHWLQHVRLRQSRLRWYRAPVLLTCSDIVVTSPS